MAIRNSFTDAKGATVEGDPIFGASEAALFVAGDKAKLDSVSSGAKKILSATNDGTNSYDSFDVLQGTGVVPNGGYMKVTGVASVVFVSSLMKKTAGTYTGKFVVDYGAFLDAVEISASEIRLYNNSGGSVGAGELKIIYSEAV